MQRRRGSAIASGASKSSEREREKAVELSVCVCVRVCVCVEAFLQFLLFNFIDLVEQITRK